jgi:hypothetical protein
MFEKEECVPNQRRRKELYSGCYLPPTYFAALASKSDRMLYRAIASYLVTSRGGTNRIIFTQRYVMYAREISYTVVISNVLP